MANWIKITDKSNNGGRTWAWVTVGGTTIGVVGANFQAVWETLCRMFGF